MRIYAMLSIYEEEYDMLDEAIYSCRTGFNGIMVFDGPTNADGNILDTTDHLKRSEHNIPFRYLYGEFRSDADKRTQCLSYAKGYFKMTDDDWVLWLDGDEILLYGEYIRSYCNRANNETGTGGTTIRIVEYDGSVANCYGKLIKPTAIKRYVMSSYEIQLNSGMTVALPNVPICSAGGIPIIGDGESTDRDSPIWALKRPPLIGEPHLLHRHGLRNPERKAQRLHEAEADSFEEMVKEGN